MMAFKQFNIYLQAVLYVIAGLNHFRVPRVYLAMMPPALPQPLTLVYLSGVAEVLLGVLFAIPATRYGAAWGLVALLIAVFPANVYLAVKPGTGPFKVAPWILWARLPLQALLIAWPLWLRNE